MVYVDARASDCPLTEVIADAGRPSREYAVYSQCIGGGDIYLGSGGIIRNFVEKGSMTSRA